MPLFQVVILETSELTYDIEADSPEAAIAIWATSEDSGQRGEPQEDLMDHEVVVVYDSEGVVVHGPLTS